MASYVTNNLKYVFTGEASGTTTIQFNRKTDGIDTVNFSLQVSFAQGLYYQSFSNYGGTNAKVTMYLYGNSGYLGEQVILDKEIYNPNLDPGYLWGIGKMYNWNLIDTETNSIINAPTRGTSEILASSYGSLVSVLGTWGYITNGEGNPPVSYEPFLIRFLSDTTGDLYTPRNKTVNGIYPFSRPGYGNEVPFSIQITNDQVTYFTLKLETYRNSTGTNLGSYTFGSGSEFIVELESRGYHKNPNWTDTARFYEKVSGTWTEKHGYEKAGLNWNRVR